MAACFRIKKGIKKRADAGQRSLFAVGVNVLWQVSPRTFARCVTVQVRLSASSVIAGRYALNQAAVRCIAIASAVRHSRVRFVPLPPLLNHSRECISRNLNNIYFVFLPEVGYPLFRVSDVGTSRRPTAVVGCRRAARGKEAFSGFRACIDVPLPLVADNQERPNGLFPVRY